MTAHAVPLDEFDTQLKKNYTEVSSAAFGGRVLACSDDFFASCHNLIKPAPSVSMKGQFGPNGALYDGWESRRHNPSYDWVIVQLGPRESHLDYVDIDTSHFSGNECPESAVFGIRLAEGEDGAGLRPGDRRWEELLPVVTLGPNSRHVFALNARAKEGVWSAVVVRMIPDGGMARFRAYGRALPPTPLPALPSAEAEPINLLSPLVGGHIVACSDANFSPPENLLRAGRGHDMSDGWETRRSQVGRGKYAPGAPLAGTERKEWVVAKLGTEGVLRHVEIDTAFHPGNYPVAAGVEAVLYDGEEPGSDAHWVQVVPPTRLGSHRQHWLAVDPAVSPTAVFSHVRMSIYPDGGLKRLRVFGYPISAAAAAGAVPSRTAVRALPLTYEAFAPYGHVIQAWSLPSSAPRGVPVSTANQGTAAKFHRLAPIAHNYPASMLKRGGVALANMRAAAQYDVRSGATIPISKLERHAATTQAFLPQGRGAAPGETPLSRGGTFLVIVALSTPDGAPDMSTLRAFVPTAAQGVSYNEGVWHSPMLTLNETMDYACLDAQTGEDGVVMDCETRPVDFDVVVPPYDPAAAAAAAPAAAGDAGDAGVDSNVATSAAMSAATSAATNAATLATTALTAPLARLAARATGAVRPEPLTPASWAPFGDLIRAYPSGGAPASAVVGGNAALGITKLSWLSSLENSYPEGEATTAVGVYRATPKAGCVRGHTFDIRLMERHKYTSQAFIPMGKDAWGGRGEEALPDGGCFLVVVAENGQDDRPDPATLRAFIMPSGTGLNYKPGVWHHPVLVLDAPLDLACIETQVGTGARGDADPRDCELLAWEGDEVFGRVAVPSAP